MENLNKYNHIKNSGRVWSGLIIVIIGFAFLLNNMGLDIPHWVFSFWSFLIVLGLFIGFRRNFKGVGWLILILIGSYNTIDNMHLDFDISKYALGLGLVIVGVFLIVKPKGAFGKKRGLKDSVKDEFSSATTGEAYKTTDRSANNYNDILDVTAIFGGSNQTVYSKNFKGGDITAVFGGADIIMTQADFTEDISLDVTAVFGGIKLIVPPNWAIKSNVTALFGSVEDKRSHMLPVDQMNKTLVLDGTVLFGGIEIKSF
ncbi:LiaF transmembrane domain-containing protein [Pedobacter mucosus]|uniref:LiaF transmembrane domain-containing protein n=1 Tax=Pedobacter mucosus TaxID=2895286 RepID=UPI001EE3D74D|nr:LiaF domain-containing protein [Pedobacter mucosus]UKT65123.1 cell wall-active antibiotics response protein [Pedobacter mucosus]